MRQVKKIRIGEELVYKNKLNPGDLDIALQLQKNTSRKLGKILVEQGFVSEEDIAQIIAEQTGVPFIQLKNIVVDPNASQLLTEIQARKYRTLVFEKTQATIKVAMSDPSDLFNYEEAQQTLGHELTVFCVTESDLLSYIDIVYKVGDNLQNIVKDVSSDVLILQSKQDLNLLEDAPVIRLLQSIFEDAYKNKSSDIHIEPQSNKTLIRFRVNGELFIYSELPKEISSPLVSRLKIVSMLDIAEKRLPQDGRFSTTVRGETIDMRLSILPQSHGEAAVIRLLQKKHNFKIEDLCMPQYIREGFEQSLQSNEGTILTVGPTGSGKTTTLYTGINLINNVNTKIITIEDPVEYQIDLINQISVNEKIGFDFGMALRTILRQDPDVIMIGEIRDTQTAQIAMRASITGHLILSTLHTKDVYTTPIRLIDMGVPNYLVAAALNCILSQRLIKINCPNCLVEYSPTNEEQILGQRLFGDRFLAIKKLHKSTGCIKCNQTGFAARKPVYEAIFVNQDLRNLIQIQDWQEFYKVAKTQVGTHSIEEALFNLICKGVTTPKQAFKLLFS